MPVVPSPGNNRWMLTWITNAIYKNIILIKQNGYLFTPASRKETGIGRGDA